MSVLPTFAKLPMASPLKDTSARNGALYLSEDARYVLLHIRGVDAEMVLGQTDMKIGAVVSWKVAEGTLIRLRHDDFLLLARDGRGALDHLNASIGDLHVTVTDVTHGLCMFSLLGVDTTRVLQKVCALDFSEAAFPVGHAAQTSLAKVRTLIIRFEFHERELYLLIVDRSLGQYVWNTVIDAMQEFI